MVSENPLNEIQQEMCSYLLNVDDMNYTMLCEPLVFASKSSCMNELDIQRASYLLNLDDVNYSMLCEPIITRYKSAMPPDMSDIRGLEKLSLVSGLALNEENMGSMELIDTESQMEFPKRKFRPVRAATLEDELADSSY